MNDLVQQLLASAGGGISVAALMSFFFKRIVKQYDEKHKATGKNFEAIKESWHEMDKRLIAIQSDVKDAINVRTEYKGLEKEVWELKASLKAAWKVIDHQRKSDCDGD